MNWWSSDGFIFRLNNPVSRKGHFKGATNIIILNPMLDHLQNAKFYIAYYKSSSRANLISGITLNFD